MSSQANDGSERGYPLLLTLSTKQVSDVVHSDDEILEQKGGKLPPDERMPNNEALSDRLESIRHVCAAYYLEGYARREACRPNQRFLPCLHHGHCASPVQLCLRQLCGAESMLETMFNMGSLVR